MVGKYVVQVLWTNSYQTVQHNLDGYVARKPLIGIFSIQGSIIQYMLLFHMNELFNCMA